MNWYSMSKQTAEGESMMQRLTSMASPLRMMETPQIFLEKATPLYGSPVGVRIVWL